ncbi:MAG: CDP-alcohol phosphatidyltransferase family protein [Patescibacteria group bacterium]|nr:CDP-alcohol phosphatidyltransferase family protein [Patescibacteria group bacterium]
MKKLDKIIDISNEKSKKFRAKYFHWIIKALDSLGFTANSLSFLRVLSGVIFFFLLTYNFTISLIILIIGAFTDFFDGALARYHKKDNDRGKFIDMLCDNLLFLFFILGLIKIEFVSSLNLAYFIFILPALYIMIVINKNEFLKNDWIIIPYARITYYKIIFEIVFLLVIIFGVNKNFLNSILLILNILMSVHFSFHFYKFLTKKV